MMTAALEPGQCNPPVGLNVSDSRPLLVPIASTIVPGSFCDWSDLILKLIVRALRKLFAPLARVGGLVGPFDGSAQD